MKRKIEDLNKFRFTDDVKKSVQMDEKLRTIIIKLPFHVTELICEYIPNEKSIVIQICPWYVRDKIYSLKHLLTEGQLNALVLSVIGKNYHTCVLGPPGTGKSFFIHHLIDLLKWIGASYAVVAKSALAAQSVGGTTLERFFGKSLFTIMDVWDNDNARPREGFNVKEVVHAKRNRVDYIIVDEASMISDVRLDQLLYMNPNTRIVLVGDVKQLPPIEDRPMFTASKEIVNFNKGLLRVVMRQTADSYEGTQYLKFIDDVGNGNKADAQKVIAQRSEAFRGLSSEQHLKLTFLCATNARAAEQNSRCYALIQAPEFSITIPEPVFHIEVSTWFKRKQERTVSMQAELEPDVAKKMMKRRVGYNGGETVTYKPGSRVIVTQNIEKYQLYNGTLCTLIAINETIAILEEVNGEKRTISYNLHEICIILSTERIHTYGQIIVKERQAQMLFYPFALAFAITVHKAQGQTLGMMAIDIPYSIGQGLEYVAVSRCKDIKDMFIKSFPLNWRAVDMKKRLGKLLNNKK